MAEIYSRKETITPERAASILKEQEVNEFKNFRTLNPSDVRKYADDMKNNRWEYNDESLQFGPNGELLNGQHRLNACIAAGVPFTTRVAYNVSASIFDVGKGRTGRDYLGGDLILSGIANLVIRYKMGDLISGSPKTKPSIPQIMNIVEELPDLKKYAESVKGFPCQRVALGFLWWMFGQSHPNKARDFFKSFKENDGLRSKSPIWQLRRKLVEDKPKGGRFTQSTVLGYGVSAFNAYLLGTETIERFFPAKDLKIRQNR